MGITAVSLPDLVSFAPGYPDADCFPWEELQEIATRLLTNRDSAVLQYGPTQGCRPLIDALVLVLSERGIAASPENVLVTTGSQQGIDLVARVFIDPGDVVLVECPTYTGAISVFRNAGACLSGIRQDDKGIDVDDLERVCAREQQAGGRVKLLYLTPNFQNPSGVLLDAARRARLLEWASRTGIVIVEDDPYGTLYFDKSAAPSATRPLCADDTDGCIVYLSTFSKTLAPGFRVGWMVAPTDLVDRCEAVKQSLDLLTGTLDQHIVLEALRRDLPNRLAPRLRDTYRRRLGQMENALKAACGSALQWSSPKGGFFLWVELPRGINDEVLLARAIERRLVFVTGSAFFVDGTGHDRIRLSYSSATEHEMEEGARRLATAIESCAKNPAAADS